MTWKTWKLKKEKNCPQLEISTHQRIEWTNKGVAYFTNACADFSTLSRAQLVSLKS